MSADDRAQPAEVYRRTDPDVDPPTVALGLDIERDVTEGEALLFVDDEPEPTRAFELQRIGGAFRISDRVAPPRGVFASAQAAIAAGWAMIDRTATLPPFSSLIDDEDPHGGFR